MSPRPSTPVTARELLALTFGGLTLTALALLGFSYLGPLGAPDAAPWMDPVGRLRLLRLLAAAVTGAALGLGGAATQGLLRNPLAEPYVLGLSSGAGVGVRLAGALAAAGVLPAAAVAAGLPLIAFAGAAAAGVMVYAIAQRRGRLDPYSLLLSGVIVNVFNGALMMGLYLLVDPFQADTFARWSMGELPDAVRPDLLLAAGAATALGAVLLVRRAAALNALALGDDVARSSGLPVARLRIEVFSVVSMLAAAACALAGPVGFVGLIVPHLARMALGPDHRRLMLGSAAGGALLVMAADTACRVAGGWMGTGRLPAGLLTALLGGPFFVLLLRRRMNAEGD